MKITGFNPLIVTKDPEATVRLFEALGFEKCHNPTGTSAVGNEYNSYRMTDANGFHVDVSTTAAPMKQDLTAAHGFTSGQNGTVTNTGSAKACILFSSSGFAINLIQHIKDHD